MNEIGDDYNTKDKDNMVNRNRFIVYGKGIVNVKPDSAEVIIGVITENVQLETAQQENASITTQVINSIISIGVLPNQIQTESYTIRTEYDYIDGKQVFKDYEVSNNLKILITDVRSIGEIIDTAVKNGANNVNSINFIVSNDKRYYYQSLIMAVTDAQNKANVMANKLNVRLDPTPVQIRELSRDNIAPLQSATFKSASISTPIEAGENKIISEVEVIFRYSE